MITLLEILKEIADSEAYEFSRNSEDWDEEDNSLLAVDYTFNTPKYPYKVSFYSGEYKPEDKTFELSFGVNMGDFNKLDTFQMTGEGKVTSILKTIAKIIEEFLYQYDEEAEKIVIKPTSEKRRKVYKALMNGLPSDVLSKIVLK